MSLGTGAIEAGLVGAPRKYQVEQGGSMATLWAGTSPESGHQSGPSFRGETHHTRYLPWTTSYQGRTRRWIGKIGDQSSDPQSSTKQANCNCDDQGSDPSKVSGADSCYYVDFCSHASTWQGKPLQPPQRSQRPLDAMARGLATFCLIIESNSQKSFFRNCSVHQHGHRDVTWKPRIGDVAQTMLLMLEILEATDQRDL